MPILAQPALSKASICTYIDQLLNKSSQTRHFSYPHPLPPFPLGTALSVDSFASEILMIAVTTLAISLNLNIQNIDFDFQVAQICFHHEYESLVHM